MKQARKARFGLILIFGILATAIVCLILVFSDYNRKSERHQQSLAFLSKARDLDRTIDEDVLLTRSLLLANYDDIVHATEAITDLCGRFDDPNGFWKVNEEALDATGPAYCEAVKAKLETVESFKSNNSILRNVRAYIPVLIDQFQGTPYDERSDHLMIYVFRYFLEQHASNRAAVENAMLWTAGVPKTSKFSANAESLHLNVEILLREIRRRTELESFIFSGAVRDRYADVEAAYLAAFAQDQKRSNRYRAALLALCSLLTVAFVFIMYRLNSAGEELAQLNQTLEEKVEARTFELQQASQRLSENQQMLTQTTKMSALGEMAGGIAHEINTPLAAILLCSESLEKAAKKAGDAEMVAGLNDIGKTVQRISRIVVGLRRFSRDSSSEKPRPISIAEIIDETLILCREKFRNHGIALEVGDPGALQICCVPEQVSQVLLNLLNNSFDAICPLPEKWIRIETRRRDGACEIAVTDSGSGIPPSVQAKLMQPFFTTKEIGKGTGLGLSISKGLLEAQKGALLYDPTSAHTRFVMRMPEYDEYQVA